LANRRGAVPDGHGRAALMREFAGFPAFNLLHVKALELSAQFFSPDCSARLSLLVGFVTQFLHARV
jgi:hypothetical protein